MKNPINIDSTMLIIFGVVLAIAIVFSIVFIVVSRKNKRVKQLDTQQDRISVLKALPVQYLLNKVSLMPKTPDIEVSYQEWKEVYKKLVDEDHKMLNELTGEIDNLIYSRKHKLASVKLRELSVMISKYENEYESLLEDLTRATQVDVKNREEITNQKELFRNYKKMYKSNTNNYNPFNNAIERYLEDIENSFTNIDILLNQSEVDKALNRAASLEGDLLKMKDILNNLPVILEDLTKDLPYVLTEVEHKYNNLIKKKFNILSLDIPNRLSKVRKQILGSLSKNHDVFIKDLQDAVLKVDFELKAMLEELDHEEIASEQIEKLIDTLVTITYEADKKAQQANELLKHIIGHYTLVKNEQANVEMETRLLANIIDEKNDIVVKHERNSFTATKIEKDINRLLPRVKAINIAFNAYIKHVETLRSDEKRLHDEYHNMLYIIKDCEARLREMNLPMLSNAYYETIVDSKNKLLLIDNMLKDKPLNIQKINKQVTKACNLVYKLYDNSRNLIKTAQMAENTIVFGNRYRVIRPEVNTMLTRAENYFNNGEYTKSLSGAIEAIEIIHPSVRKELLKYKSKQLDTNA